MFLKTINILADRKQIKLKNRRYKLQELKAVIVIEDGNCFFRAVCLFDKQSDYSEKNHQQLKLGMALSNIRRNFAYLI